MRFILQSDPDASSAERNSVRHASMLDDGIEARQRDALDDLLSAPPGSRSGDRDLCPVGTVEFCRAWMKATGVAEPPPLDYPSCLDEALHRPIVMCPMDAAPVGSWIKPVLTKAWNARLRTADDAGDQLVWWTPYIPSDRWRAEWRIYVVDGAMVAACRYDEGEEDPLDFDRAEVESWIRLLAAEGPCPAGFALDVALLGERTVLVEVTDGWAIGCYRGISPADYTKLLWRRWTEISQKVAA